MSKKLTKEELEQDPLLETVAKVSNFYAGNKTIILAVFIGGLVVVGSLAGYKIYSESQETEAQNILAAAEQYYSEGEFDKALYGDEIAFTPGMLTITSQYSGTNAGNLASYYAAVSFLRLSNYSEALAYIQNYVPPKGIMGVGAVSLHADILLANDKTQEAASMYLKAANWDINNSTTPFNLLKAAKTYAQLGDWKQAEKYALEITTEYANSDQLAEAQRLIGAALASK